MQHCSATLTFSVAQGAGRMQANLQQNCKLYNMVTFDGVQRRNQAGPISGMIGSDKCWKEKKLNEKYYYLSFHTCMTRIFEKYDIAEVSPEYYRCLPVLETSPGFHILWCFILH